MYFWTKTGQDETTEPTEEWEQASLNGYTVGEAERHALAIANSELRSVIREVRRLVIDGKPHNVLLDALEVEELI